MQIKAISQQVSLKALVSLMMTTISQELDNQNRRLNNHNHSQVATSLEVTFMI